MAQDQDNSVDLRAQIEEDYLTCQICQGPYNKPKALGCLHSFCTYCLNEYIAAKKVTRNGSFECPVCRKPANLPNNGVQGFADNHLIVSLADTITSAQRRPSLLQQRVEEIVDNNSGEWSEHFQESINRGTDIDRDFDGIFDSNEDVFPTVGEATVASDGSSDTVVRRDSTRSDRSTINRIRNLQQMEDHNLMHTLSNITDRMHVFDEEENGRENRDNIVVNYGGSINRTNGEDGCYNLLNQTIFDTYMRQSQRIHNTRLLTVNPNAGAQLRTHPITPSHMQIRIEDLPSVSHSREVSSTRNEESREINLASTRHHSDRQSEDREDNVNTTQQGFYPASRNLPHMSNTRVIPSNPIPIQTLGEYGSSLFNLHTPVGLVTTHDGKMAVVSDQNKSRLLIYDLKSGNIHGCIKCEGDIKDVTISTMGHILVTTQKCGPCLACAYTLEGYKISSLGNVFAHENAHGIGASIDHKVVVTCLSGAVYVLNENGKMLHQFGRRGRDMTLFATPYYVTFNHRNQVLISDLDANSIKVYDISGQFQFSFGGSHAEAKELNRPSGLIVDIHDNIIVCDFGSGSVKLFTSGGKFVKSIVKYPQNVGLDHVVRPLNVAIANDDKLLVLIRGSHFAQIQVFEYNLDLVKVEPNRSSICSIA